jgi:hypothetical protein
MAITHCWKKTLSRQMTHQPGKCRLLPYVPRLLAAADDAVDDRPPGMPLTKIAHSVRTTAQLSS